MLLASRFKRFLASIIDTMLIVVLMIFVTIVIYKLFKIVPPLFYLESINSLVFYFFAFGISTLYYALFESSYLKATPGKKIFGLYVIAVDGNKISFIKAGIRCIALYCIFMICSVFDAYIKHAIYQYFSDEIQYFSDDFWAFFAYAELFIKAFPKFLIINIIWIVPILFTKRRQGTHELITSTMVCRQK